MSPSDARAKQQKKLLETAESQFGAGSHVRVFESAEGSLTPLTLADAQATARAMKAEIDTALASSVAGKSGD